MTRSDHGVAEATSEELFLAFAGGDDAGTLERLLERHLAGAVALSRRILASQVDADDSVQEALVRLVKTAHRYDGSVPFAAWFGQLVRYAAMEHRRSRGQRARREQAAAGREIAATGPDSDHEELVDAIRTAMAELPESYRAPIELHYYAHLSQDEVAHALGLKPNAVAQRIHRGRERLREALRRGGVIMGLAALADALSAPAGADEPGSSGPPTDTAAATRRALRAARAARARGRTTAARSALGVALVAALTITAVAMLPHAAGSTAADAPVAVAKAPAPTAAGPHGSEATTPAVVPSTVASRKIRTWHFEDPPEGIFPTQNTWHHRTGGGVADSGCMETDSDAFLAVIDPGDVRIPFKATFWFRPSEEAKTRPEPTRYDFFLGPMPVSETVGITNAGTDRDSIPFIFDTVDALPLHCFFQLVGSDSLCTYREGKLTMLGFFRPHAEMRCLLYLSHPCIFDDLTIEEIEPSELPDLGALRHALDAVPSERRTGRVELAGTVGADGEHPISAEFSTPHWEPLPPELVQATAEGRFPQPLRVRSP